MSQPFSPSRQLDVIDRFDTRFEYPPDNENVVADALFRVEAVSMRTTLDTRIRSEAQTKDEKLPQFIASPPLKFDGRPIIRGSKVRSNRIYRFHFAVRIFTPFINWHIPAMSYNQAYTV